MLSVNRLSIIYNITIKSIREVQLKAKLPANGNESYLKSDDGDDRKAFRDEVLESFLNVS